MDDLLELAHLVIPYTICGEGNVSKRDGDNLFYIKASGTSLHTLSEQDLVPCRMNAVPLDSLGLKPSIETLFHAWIFDNFPEINFISHTHPNNTVKILCSDQIEHFANRRLFPDQIVRIGRKSCIVPYASPGKDALEKVKESVSKFVEEEGYFPKLILLENHGIISASATQKECVASTLMCEKSAEIFIGARLLGQTKFLTEEEVLAVDKCPNENYRRKLYQ